MWRFKKLVKCDEREHGAENFKVRDQMRDAPLVRASPFI
jgi:hypothetical protein